MPIGSYWFVFKPRNEQISQARKEIEHKELLLEKPSRGDCRAKALLVRTRRSCEIELVQSRLPSDKEVDVILRQVAEFATQNNLARPRPSRTRSPRPNYMEQPLEMLITGNFDDYYNFMLETDRSSESLAFPDESQGREQNGQMQAEFTLSIYFEPTSSIASADRSSK